MKLSDVIHGPPSRYKQIGSPSPAGKSKQQVFNKHTPVWWRTVGGTEVVKFCDIKHDVICCDML